jgi:hypothetical protein
MTLTKTLRFDDDVLTVLRRMEWSEDGRLGKITGGQLERKLYEKLNKALELMGGKWTRKLGGHVFAADPRPMVEGLLTNGALTVERDGFFETPRAVVERMLELVPLPRFSVVVLEPSAGMGAILKSLVNHPNAKWHLFYAIEKNAARYKHLVENFPDVRMIGEDFMEYRLPRYRDGEVMTWYQRIYMNPPFEECQDIDHVRHAYDLLQPDRVGDRSALVSVMGEHAFFANDRKSVEFREWLDEVGGYSEQLPPGSFKESGTGVAARLVVIHK